MHKSTSLKWQDAHYWYCCSTVVFVDQVGAFLEHVHRILKASERFLTKFPVVSLYFTCLMALLASTATTATIT